MARHCFNMSKHKIGEKINLLRLIEVLVQDYCDMPDAKVYMPMTEKWDGVIEIPDLTLDQIAQRIVLYYDITEEQLAKARQKLGLPDRAPFDEVPIASSSKTDYAIRPWE